uniref:Protein TASOR-like n=1 Tax=Sinocyclocheilus rhinocerous TaxID=307959 RepID=A0A673LY94_9TELE
MACNFSQERKIDKESSKAGGLTLEDGDSKKQLLSASSTATSKQNGDQAGCEDEQMSEQDASERRRAGLSDLKNCGGSPSTLPRSAEELPRRNFQIPRKIKERRGLLQQLSPDSREFEEVVKLLSTFYLDTTSRGTFTYTKASLIHNELLEKEFIEKKRELKQNGRTEAELAESYAFLLPDKNKVHWICEKGLSVGHSRINNLGSPVKGVYLSKYSDLLQMNPFEVGAAGDIIIFKIMKGKVKTIFENMPKNNLEPTLKYDSHALKNASKVTSLLSYRAFEHTQQYFYEFAFEELRSRPRHVLPYAVVSFQYKVSLLCLFIEVSLYLGVYVLLILHVFLVSKNSGVDEDPLAPLEPKDPISHQIDNFVPALHHGFYKLRANPPKELAVGLKRQVLDYLSQKEQGVIRPFHIVEYRHSLDDRTKQHPAPRPKNMDVALNSYIFGPGQFQLPVEALQQDLMDSQQGAASPPAGAEEYSPVSDWGGSDRQVPGSSTIGVSQSNGGAQRPQGEYEKEKMEKLLKLIQLHKRTLGKDEGSGSEREEDWDPAGLKRRLEREELQHQSITAVAQKHEILVDIWFTFLLVVMDSMGLCDTDLRERVTQSATLQDTHALLKLFLSTLNRMAQNTASSQPVILPKSVEGHDPSDSAAHCDLDLRGRRADEEQVNQNCLEPWTGYVNTLCEKMSRLVQAPRASVQPVAVVSPPAVASVPAPLPPALPPSAMPAPAQPMLPSPPAHSHTKTSSPVPKSQALSSKPQATLKPPSGKHRLGTIKEVHLFSAEKSADPKSADVVENPICSPSSGSASQPPIASVPEIPSEPSHAGTSSTVGGRVIGQIEPDVLCTLVEIMQKNAVKFYIQRGDEESELCTEIKEYLRSLGNIDCNPQNYLESKSQQKFMIIIQNEDIAAHVHKIPALVSLKKLPTVYFAGVDSLDDVKNRTYNELFVSGGLIVSDELILNPDNITLEKLRAFLKFLEEQGSPWKWKVHCKTQKKLKELSRLNTEALDLLNLLTTYQKKHLVEFLPYHECDTPSRQAPDLDCLVKLQAQHTQLRHFIFLTGMCNRSMEPDAVRDEEDMSIDSEDEMPVITETSIQTENDLMEPQAPQPPPPQTDGFRPPLPDQPSLDYISDPLVQPNPSAYPTQGSYSTDYAALKSAIAQYKAASQESTSRPEVEDTLASFGVNPHQSYLCSSSAQWSPYSGSPAYHMSSAYSSPVSVASRGSEYSQTAAPPGTQPPTNTSTIPVAQPLTFPLSLPQPPVEVPSTPESGTCLHPPGQSLPIPDSVGVPGVAMASTANQLGLAGSQTAKLGVESASSSSATSSSSLHTTFPSYPDTTNFPALTPIPPVPPLFGWGPTPGAQQGYAAGQSGAGFSTLPSTQTEASRPADGSWPGTIESETARGQEEEGAPTSATSKVVQQEAGGEKGGAMGSSAACGQGSRTPVNTSCESQSGSQAPPTRGGTASRGLLPIPGAALGPLCRGGHNNSMYNPRGGHADMMRGGFRGRGVPPHPMRSRPGWGHIRGGPSCNWGYPPGRGGGGRSDYYSDYTYN